MKRKWYQYIAVLLICIFALTGCGSSQEKAKENRDSAPEIAGLTYEKTMNLTYAEEFDVYYYKGGYKLINIQESGKYLIVPEGKEAPDVVKKALEEGLMVLTAKDKVRLLPPLTITYDEIDQGVEILKKALS